MELEHIEAIEKRLWSAADTLRANSNYASNEYFLPVMGLIFLRHAYSRYLAVKDNIEAKLPKRGGKTRALSKEDFSQKNAIFLSPKAQFDTLVALTDSDHRAKAIIEAMESIEGDYDKLRGVLPKSEYRELDNRRKWPFCAHWRSSLEKPFGTCLAWAAVRGGRSESLCTFQWGRGAEERRRMNNNDLNWIANFIWGIADDVLRDIYVRGKYRDVILPMTVIRRLDALLEPTKKAALEKKDFLDKHGVSEQRVGLAQASGQAFYNTSPFTLRDLKVRARQQQLKADFEAYLDGFSPNVQDILDNFEFRNQISRLSKVDALGTLIEKFLDPSINLSPNPVYDSDGNVRLHGLDNHAMGTIFKELIRRFNEENNEEAGEHWAPRDVVKLMAKLIFLPIANQILSGTYLIYDGACGTGGMLTVAEETLQQLAGEYGKEVATHLYGQEINAETYAICKADLLLKGEGEAADNIVGGPEHSTLSNDAFRSREFEFMLSNPPYGKSWKTDLERMGGKGDIRDPRFVIEHAGDPEFSLITRSSDGQLLFLVNKLSKMKHSTPLGSRIAEVHNGSSLFTGDAGQGENGTHLFFRAKNGGYHTFLEVAAKDAARDCGATVEGNTRQMCKEVWGKN